MTVLLYSVYTIIFNSDGVIIYSFS